MANKIYAIQIETRWFCCNSFNNAPLLTEDVTKRAIFSTREEAEATAIVRSNPLCKVVELEEDDDRGVFTWRNNRPTPKQLQKSDDFKNI